MFAATISALSFVYLLITSWVVLLNGIRKNVNIFLAAALIFIGLWMIGVAALSTSFGDNILNGRLIFTNGLIGIELLYLFTYFFLGSINSRARSIVGPKILIPGALVLAALSTTPLVVESMTVVGDGKLPKPVFGPVYPLVVLWVLMTATVIAWLLFKSYKKSYGLQKNQIQTILLGLIVFVGAAILTNVVLPLIRGNAEPAKLAPLSTIILGFTLSYAVLKHKFLDIRLIVARTIAYLLLLGTLSMIFAAAFFTLTTLFFKQEQISTYPKIAYIAVALVVALLLQPLRKFFDKATNRLFYRDAYDPQELLNELNRSLVQSIEIEDVLKKSSKIIAETFKASYCAYIVHGASNAGWFVASKKISLGPDQISDLESALTHLDRKITLIDDLDDLSKHSMKSHMLENDIAVAVKLKQAAHSKVRSPGYLLLGHRLSGGIYNDDDLRIVEIIADELVIAIQNSLRFEEIQQFNVTLQEKVEQATKELRHANTKLKELDKTKDEFISMASHQLRTPLTTIKGYLSMIMEGDMGAIKKDQKETIKLAFESANNMVDLIADLLNISRLQSGKFVIENKPTDLLHMVKTETKRLEEQAKARNIQLALSVPASLPMLNIDETKVRQVVMNLIDNALYYTPSGGTVTVALECTDDTVSYTVTDTGVGVPKETQHHLFSKFYRADNARKMRPDGTGLGLFMAKKVIVAQGGAIIFKSAEGKGSTFGFSLPRKKLEVKQ